MVNDNRFSYVTVLCNDSYAPGIIALAYSLKRVKSRFPLSVLILDTVSDEVVKEISKLANTIIDSNRIQIPKDLLSDNIADFKKWNNTFFKLNVARLTQFEKIVLIDADMIVKSNIDELFVQPNISCVSAGELLRGNDFEEFNSGLLVLEPSVEVFQRLVEAIPMTKEVLGNKPFGDQDVFRYVFQGWPQEVGTKLHERYNCYATDLDELVEKKLISYKEVKVIHYAMAKPWIVSKLYPLQMINMDLKLKHRIKCFYKINTYYFWWDNYKKGLQKIRTVRG